MSEAKANLTERYPVEVIDPGEDDGTMPDTVQELRDQVIGRKIVKAEQGAARYKNPYFGFKDRGAGLILTLDNGKRVILADTDDCCAFTELESFFLNVENVDHVITGVGTTDGFTRWHIYADFGDILSLDVDWSAGNPFYYGYGFDIAVIEDGDNA